MSVDQRKSFSWGFKVDETLDVHNYVLLLICWTVNGLWCFKTLKALSFKVFVIFTCLLEWQNFWDVQKT